MYFPGDPLLAIDPIFNSVPDAARDRLVASSISRRRCRSMRSAINSTWSCAAASPPRRNAEDEPRQTPSQTVGPFFRPALIEAGGKFGARKTRGERVTIEGRVIDGDGAPVTDAMLEIWQANAEGRYDHPDDEQEKLLDPDFHGYGRAATDARGEFRF